MLPGGTDALYCAFCGEVQSKLRSELMARLCDAKTTRADVAIDMAGAPFALSHRSREGWWHLANADFRITIDENETLLGWSLSVIPDAKFLARHGDREALARARSFARGALRSVDGERIRRIDLAVDIIGPSPGDLGLERWQTMRAKLRPTLNPREDERGRVTLCLETIEFGKRGNDVFVRIYDKRAELLQRGDGEKTALEEERWRQHGWNGTDPVTRVEAQVSSDGLKTFGLRDDPDEVLAKRAGIWAYVTRKWLRLVVSGRTRLKRCHTDERWKAVQEASFDTGGEMLSRTRVRGNEKLLRAMSCTLSALAGAGVLRARPFNDHEYIHEHSRDCLLFVKESLRQLLGSAGAMMADELVRVKGPRGACESFMAKWNAACARASNVHSDAGQQGQASEQVACGGSR
ncbi:MAG TPA: hypothetical protein VEK07_25115, partial [Polyangiaceae bacterium]|nr:hypothetical protein [Polyangiaceae bacterium]